MPPPMMTTCASSGRLDIPNSQSRFQRNMEQAARTLDAVFDCSFNFINSEADRTEGGQVDRARRDQSEHLGGSRVRKPERADKAVAVAHEAAGIEGRSRGQRADEGERAEAAQPFRKADGRLGVVPTGAVQH